MFHKQNTDGAQREILRLSHSFLSISPSLGYNVAIYGDNSPLETVSPSQFFLCSVEGGASQNIILSLSGIDGFSAQNILYVEGAHLGLACPWSHRGN